MSPGAKGIFLTVFICTLREVTVKKRQGAGLLCTLQLSPTKQMI